MIKIFKLFFFLTILILNSNCAKVESTKSFNHGVRAYNSKDYMTAVNDFKKASKIKDPRIYLNLCISHLSYLKSKKLISQEDLNSAEQDISISLSLEGLSDIQRVQILYIKGRIYLKYGNNDLATEAFQEALEIKSNYKPALKALVEISEEKDTPLAKLVLLSVDIEEPKIFTEL